MNQAQLDLLKVRLARTTVRAPFGGTSGQRFVSLGDYVTTSDKLATLQTVNPAAHRLCGAGAVRQSIGARASGSCSGSRRSPGRNSRARWISWIRWSSCPRAPSWSRRWCPTGAVSSRPACSSRCASRPKYGPRPSSSRRMPSSRCNAPTTCGSSPTAKPAGIRWRSECARRGLSRSGAAVEAGEQVVVGGQERLAEGAPVAATIVERGPVAPGRQRRPGHQSG